ncbi:MAG: (d)CMP kinase [Eggerthellaceae bacterium]|nr:(d)CMP kinase [Eggerthellaceae bacterium]
MIIAIDGPSGAGKSSVSGLVAKELGFNCLDTGAMYRAVAVFALDSGVATDDVARLTEIAQGRPIEFSYRQKNPSPVGVSIDGRDVTREIRSAEADRAVTPVCQVAGVREALVDQQRRIVSFGDFVVEGRDIGTVVFPDAELKIFMTASAEARAWRRVLQNEERGVGYTDFKKVLDDMQCRDEADSTRSNSPLKPAEDSIIFDTTEYTQNQVVEQICKLARDHG